MKLSHSFTALAACASLALSAGAQTVTANGGDLLLGFRASSGTGSSSNLEVDLGAFSDYTSGGTFNDGSLHLIGNLSANDLSSTYGASWNTRSDVTWGIAGATGNSLAGYNVYASKLASTLGTQSDPYDAMTKNALNTVAAPINGAVSGLNGATATGNSASSAVLATTDPISWSAFQDPSATSVSFNAFDTALFENSTNITSGYVVSDLYKLSANSVTYVGSFGLASDGKLYYSSSAASFSAVPEPSTYAAILGVAVLGFVAVRRRRQARLVAAA